MNAPEKAPFELLAVDVGKLSAFEFSHGHLVFILEPTADGRVNVHYKFVKKEIVIPPGLKQLLWEQKN